MYPRGDPRKIRERMAAEERLRNLKNCTVFWISAARRGFEKIEAGGGGYRCIRRVSLYANFAHKIAIADRQYISLYTRLCCPVGAVLVGAGGSQSRKYRCFEGR